MSDYYKNGESVSVDGGSFIKELRRIVKENAPKENNDSEANKEQKK